MDWLSWENCNRKAPLNTWENQGMQTLPRWSLQAYVSCNLKHVYFALLGIYIYIFIYMYHIYIYMKCKYKGYLQFWTFLKSSLVAFRHVI